MALLYIIIIEKKVHQKPRLAIVKIQAYFRRLYKGKSVQISGRIKQWSSDVDRYPFKIDKLSMRGCHQKSQLPNTNKNKSASSPSLSLSLSHGVWQGKHRSIYKSISLQRIFIVKIQRDIFYNKRLSSHICIQTNKYRVVTSDGYI